MNASLGVHRELYCPHCYSVGSQQLVRIQPSVDRCFSENGEEIEDYGSTFVAVCDSCGRVLLYENPGDELEQEKFHLGSLSYPTKEWLHWSVPRRVCDAYEEATRLHVHSPEAFIGQAFMALEAVCQDHGATGASLRDKFRHLSTRGTIPQAIVDIADALIESASNNPPGAALSRGPLRMRQFDELFRAVVEHVYVGPAKLQDFAGRIAESTKP